ncbi:Mor transcription activator family protein [Cohnella silvisoli]|uniref:Mor transcription activator family protein n=1 Tax=Cohnella silvisoli TaxID=2873699 RepID=A0ABV1L233_9BACL|nr:Mor transcription activator family protein [Cohnella silvisoli]MCD9025765.1 hypothetical protein [Cohnella silvisoli]
MLTESWVHDVKPEDLPDPYHHIALEIGVMNTLKLARIFGGSQIYLPKHDNALQIVRDRQIRKEYDGYNCKALAMKYNLTENWVRSIIRGKSSSEDLDQLDLFNDGLM